jgi:hypothetical protein
VVENAMNPSPSHFAHWAVGENRSVFNWDVSLIIKPIRNPTAQRFRRELAFVHRDVEWVFIVVSTHTDRPQFFNEHFPIPESRGHYKPSTKYNVILSEAKNLGSD